MKTIRILLFYYLLYSFFILIVVDITNLTLGDIAPGLFVLWLYYLLFSIGYKLFKKNKSNTYSIAEIKHQIFNLNNKKLLMVILAILSILFAFMATYFYTGNLPINILKNIFLGSSFYNDYQKYFYEKELEIFSIKKIPFILMLFYIKFLLFYSYIYFLLYRKKIKSFQKIFLFCITFSYIYFGLARGTGIEIFEIMILFTYVFFKRNYKRRLKLKNAINVIIVLIISFLFFVNQVRNRGIKVNNGFTDDLIYDANGIISKLIPNIFPLIATTYGYLGFGFYYLSEFIKKVWLYDSSSFIAGIFPFGFKLIGYSDIREVMRKIVYMGAKWHPDSALLIGNIGFLGLMIFCVLLGYISRNIFENKYNYNKVFMIMIDFFILLQMVAMPVGNFIMISSVNKIIVLTLIIFWLTKVVGGKHKIIGERQIVQIRSIEKI